jgi:hypothetical protein
VSGPIQSLSMMHVHWKFRADRGFTLWQQMIPSNLLKTPTIDASHAVAYPLLTVVSKRKGPCGKTCTGTSLKAVNMGRTKAYQG